MSPTRSPGQPTLAPFSDRSLEELDHVRMAPVAVARQPHHLPGLAVDRQRHAAGEAALGVEADGARRHRRRRRRPPAEQLLGRRLRIVGMRQRRQRLGIERAVILRVRGCRQASQAQWLKQCRVRCGLCAALTSRSWLSPIRNQRCPAPRRSLPNAGSMSKAEISGARGRRQGRSPRAECVRGTPAPRPASATPPVLPARR